MIEIKPEFLSQIGKKFVAEKDICAGSLTVGQEVFFKGFPLKSAEFHAPIEAAYFGWWAEIRNIARVHDRLAVTTPVALRKYRDTNFDEDDQDLKGISGSGVFDTAHKLIGMVWGGLDGTANSPVWIVPSAVIIEVLEAYERRQYGKPAAT